MRSHSWQEYYHKRQRVPKTCEENTMRRQPLHAHSWVEFLKAYIIEIESRLIVTREEGIVGKCKRQGGPVGAMSEKRKGFQCPSAQQNKECHAYCIPKVEQRNEISLNSKK